MGRRPPGRLGAEQCPLSEWPSRHVCLLLPAHLGVRFVESKRGYPLLRVLAFEFADDFKSWSIDTAWEDYHGVIPGARGSLRWTGQGWAVVRAGDEGVTLAHAKLG